MCLLKIERIVRTVDHCEEILSGIKILEMSLSESIESGDGRKNSTGRFLKSLQEGLRR